MRIIRKSQDDTYSNRVSVSVYGLDAVKPGMLENNDHEVEVVFRIAIEHKNWGIKGIDVSPLGIVTIPVEMSSENDESMRETVNLTFDVSLLKQEPMPSDSVTVGDIELSVNPDLTPDYEKSSIVIYGPTRRV